MKNQDFILPLHKEPTLEFASTIFRKVLRNVIANSIYSLLKIKNSFEK